MSKNRAKTRAVGRVSVAQPGVLYLSSIQVYEALEPLACARCRGRIPASALFTRRRAAGTEGGPGPVCHACAAFPDPPMA